jgi:hypothetical protein
MKDSKRLQQFFASYTRSEAVKTVANLVKPQMYKMVMPNGAFMQNEMPEGLQTKWSKLLAEVDQNQFVLETIIDAIFKQGDINSYPELYNLTLSEVSRGDVSMIFGGFPNKSQHTKFVKLIQKRLGDSFVVVEINGDETTNREVESLVKSKINKAINKGQRVILVSRDMASRSFSESRIDTVFLMYDNGLLSQTIQKVSRVFTPGETYEGETKTHGTIITLSFDDNRSELDPVDQYVVAEASRIAKEDEPLQESIKRVARSFNIFAQDTNGHKVEVEADEYAEKLISNTSLTKVCGASTKFHMIDIQACIDGGALLSARKTSAEKHQAQVNVSKAKTYIKTGDTATSRAESNEETKEAKELLQTVNYLAQNVSELSAYNDFENDNVIEIIQSIIRKGQPLVGEVEDFFGLSIDFIYELFVKQIIPTRLANTVVSGRNNRVEVFEPMW